NEFGRVGNSGGDGSAAFADLSDEIGNAVSGPSGGKVLTAIIAAIVNDSGVPSSIKQKIKEKVGQKWSGVISLSDPEHTGKGDGLVNQPSHDPSGNNVVVPSPADQVG